MSAPRAWRASAAVMIGCGLNLVLLSLPLLIMHAGRIDRLATDPRVLGLLVCATLLFFADAASLSVAAEDRAATTAIDRRQHRLALLTALLLWGTLAGGLATLSARDSIAWLAVGLALMALGALLRYLAIRTLQQQFTSAAGVEPATRQLVERGLFQHLRHPSELGLLLCGFGAALVTGSGLASAGAVALFITSLLRMRWEDEQLALAWPTTFAAYRRRVPALVPRLFLHQRAPINEDFSALSTRRVIN